MDKLLKRKGNKKGGRRSTVLLDQETIEAVCLAELGKGNDAIRKQFNIDLSDGQFQYRLNKAKQIAGFKKGDGFRRAWREGRSPYEELVSAVLPELRKNYKDQIVSQIEKPPLQVSPHKASPGPTVDEAVGKRKAA